MSVRTAERPAPDPSTQLPTRSLRRRLFWVVFGLVAVLVLVLTITTDRVLGARLLGNLEQRLSDRAVIATALDGQVGEQSLVDRLAGQGVSVRLVTADGTAYTSSGQPGSGSSPGNPPGPGRDKPPTPKESVSPVTKTGDLYQLSQPLADGSTITLSADAGEARRTLAQVRIALTVGGLIVIALALAILWPLIGRALRPLERITTTAQEIAAGDRGRRLNPDRPDTELGRTATAFDTMLDAVEGAEAQAKGSERRIRDFLSDAAHELRTPVAGTLAACERLLRTDPDRPQREALTVTAIREAQRAGRLVEQMLDMARIDQGLQLVRRPVGVRELVDEVLSTKQLSAPSARFRVDDRLPGGAVVSADPDRLTQVLVNLIDNAVHAAGPGARIDLRLARTTGPSGQGSGESEGAGTTIDVIDDGPGVPDAERERIFDRLVRLDASRARVAGAGLGLAISRGIARAHGGTLSCLPVRNGSVFRLWLPDPALGATAS